MLVNIKYLKISIGFRDPIASGDQALINTTHTIAKTVMPAVRHRKKISIEGRFFMLPEHSKLGAIRSEAALFTT